MSVVLDNIAHVLVHTPVRTVQHDIAWVHAQLDGRAFEQRGENAVIIEICRRQKCPTHQDLEDICKAGIQFSQGLGANVESWQQEIEHIFQFGVSLSSLSKHPYNDNLIAWSVLAAQDHPKWALHSLLSNKRLTDRYRYMNEHNQHLCCELLWAVGKVDIDQAHSMIKENSQCYSLGDLLHDHEDYFLSKSNSSDLAQLENLTQIIEMSQIYKTNTFVARSKALIRAVRLQHIADTASQTGPGDTDKVRLKM